MLTATRIIRPKLLRFYKKKIPNEFLKQWKVKAQFIQDFFHGIST